MKNLFLKFTILFSLLLFMQPTEAQVWEILDPLPNATGYYSGHFIDANNGWIFRTGSSTLLRTRNGGNTWTELYPMTGMRYIFMVDSLVGYLIVQEEQRKLFKTIDGGESWEQISLSFYSGNTINTSPLYFIDQNRGFVSTDNTYLWTNNGGDTWSEVELPNDIYQPTSISFIDNGFGWITTGGMYSGGSIFYSEDYGATWVNVYTCPVTTFYSTSFTSQVTGIATGVAFGTPDSKVIVQTNSNFRSVNKFQFPVVNTLSFIGKIINDSKSYYCGYYSGGEIHSTVNNYEELIEIGDFTGKTVGFKKIEHHSEKTFFFGEKLFLFTDTSIVNIHEPCLASVKNIEIMSNPVTTKIALKNNTLNGKFSLVIFGHDGRICYKKVFYLHPKSLLEIDASFLSTGVYLLNIYNSVNNHHLKFIKY